MENSKPKLGGAGLYVNNTADKTVDLKKSTVQHVHGTNPVGKMPGGHTLLPHSPIKAKGKM